MSGSKKGHVTPKGRESMSKFMREQWQDPAYREKMTAVAKANAHRGSLVRDNGFRRPPRGTPEWYRYEKLMRVLGPTAAREALGMGR